MLTLAGVAHAVQREQVSYVSLLETDPAMLDPADLGPGGSDLVTGLLGRDPGRLAQPAQLGSEQDPQHSRTAGGIRQGRLCVTRTRTGQLDRVLPIRLLSHAHHRSRATCQDARSALPDQRSRIRSADPPPDPGSD